MLNFQAYPDFSTWNTTVASIPGAHLLQTMEWGQVKARIGWEAYPRVWRDSKGKVVAAALILSRALSIGSLPTGLRVVYVPKGPLLDWREEGLRRQVLADLQTVAQGQGALVVKIDPDLPIGTGVPGEPEAQDDPLGLQVRTELQAGGWRFSAEQVQYRNTVLLDLLPDEADLLAGLKQKTRYNIRLAARKGVQVREGGMDDLTPLYRMYAETALRDGFAIRDEAYYQALWEIFLRAGYAEPLVAEVQGEPVAALVWYHFAGKAWYLHGMSTTLHREKMPNYLLQWEAMRRARAAGCSVYDLWGAPDEFTEADPMWGVFRFKQGFNGRVVRHLGAWDLPIRPTLYRLYTRSLPRILDLMRRRGQSRTRQSLSNHFS